MKKRISLFFAAMVMMMSSLLTVYVAPDADAVGGSCFFGGGACGVSGRGAYGTNDVFTGRDSNGNGSALGGVTSKQEFINFITNRFNSNNAQDKTGAQLVIAKNLQLNGRPNSANLTKWRSLMADDSVSFSRDNGFPVKRTSWYVPAKNDVFFADDNVVRDIIRIKQDGNVVSELEIPCGNLMASGRPLEERIDFDLSHRAVLDNGEADMDVRPGTTHAFHFWIKNDGPDDMDVRLKARAEWDGGARSGVKKHCNLDRGLRNNEKEEGCKNDLTIPNNASDGTKYCQRLYYTPKSSTNTNEQKSQKLCYKVVSDEAPTGNFVPSVYVDTKAAEPDTPYGWWAKVTDGAIPVSDWPDAEPYPVNTTASTRSGHTYRRQTLKQSEITWEVHRIVYTPTDNGVYDNSSTSSFACPTATCSEIATSPDHAYGKPPDGSGGTVRIDKEELLEGNLASGSRVCYVSSVYLPPQLRPQEAHTYTDYDDPIWSYHADTDGNGPDTSYWYISGYNQKTDYHQRYAATRNWRHSEYDCIMVGKRPRVQVHGGDLYARGEITTNASRYSNGMAYGSWVEYGVFSSGLNSFLASGAAYSKGSAGGQSDWAHLTFANTDPAGYGNFGLVTDAPPKIADYYAAQPKTSWSGASLSGKEGVFEATGDLSLSGGTNLDKAVVLYSTGNVTITGDITYRNSSYSPGEKLPQVIIVAKNIDITKDVRQIDAWLITTDDGSIDTCNTPGPLSDRICDQELRINGPVITDKLYLRRTAGTRNDVETERGAPAEVFNFRSDAFLWGYQQSSSNYIAQTIDLTELPPRF